MHSRSLALMWNELRSRIGRNRSGIGRNHTCDRVRRGVSKDPLASNPVIVAQAVPMGRLRARCRERGDGVQVESTRHHVVAWQSTQLGRRRAVAGWRARWELHRVVADRRALWKLCRVVAKWCVRVRRLGHWLRHRRWRRRGVEVVVAAESPAAGSCSPPP